MADAGASTMIILVASLLVSGVASVVLIEAWGDLAESSDKITSKRAADLETDVAISGDRGSTFLDNSGTPEFTLYFENIGSRHLNTTTYGIIVDGDAVDPTGFSMTLYPASGIWAPGTVMSVIVSDASFAYSDGDRAMITIVVKSEATDGYVGSASDTEEVRFYE